MERICADLRFEGRPVRLLPFALQGTDGPFTVGCDLRGGEFAVDLLDDPDYAERLRTVVSERYPAWTLALADELATRATRSA